MNQERNTWLYMLLRLIMLFSVLASLVLYQRSDLIGSDAIVRTYLVTFFTFLITTAFIFLYDKTKHINYFLSSQIAYDIIFTTALIHFTGPHDTVFTVFYLFNIIFAAILFRTRGALFAGVASSLMYFLVIWLSGEGLPHEKSFPLVTTVTAFIAISLLAGQLVEELRKSRQQINRLEALSGEIVDSLDSGLLGIDAAGHVLKINRTAATMLGIASVEHAKGRMLSELFPAVGEIEANQVRELVIKGKRRRILLSKVELPEQHSMVLLRDLTDVLELEERLQRQERLAGFDRLAAGVAHEIRNPIASISGAAQLLEGSMNGDAERERLVSLIVRESERVDRLVAQLLGFGKPPKAARGNVDMSEVLKECVEALRARQDFQELNAELILGVEESLRVNGNRDELSEVVTNLLTNAVQALAEQKKRPNRRISVKAHRFGDQVEIIVSDNGPGIPKDFIRRVFDPFFTTKVSGTGLGLAQVHRIVREHNGQVDVESEQDKGTAMRVRLPA